MTIVTLFDCYIQELEIEYIFSFSFYQFWLSLYSEPSGKIMLQNGQPIFNLVSKIKINNSIIIIRLALHAFNFILRYIIA